MNLVSRTFFGVVVAALLLVLPWDVAVADPERDRGRQDPPGHARHDDEEAQTGETDPEPESEPEEDRDGERDRDEGEASEPGAAGTHPSDSGAQDPQPTPPPPNRLDDAAATLVLSASPTRIQPGETSAIRIVVATAGDPIEHAEVLVDLPQHLALRSASHPSSTSDGPLRFELGRLAPDSEAVISLTVEGLDPGSAAQAPVRVALTADGAVVRDEISIPVGDESESALALSQSGPLLVQVGDSGSFTLTLRNGSNTPVEDAVVVAEVAPELDVVGVVPILEADAIQLGRSRTREDIVWTFDELAPGEEIQLAWTARAVLAGDLEATMSAEASAADAPSTSVTQTTYLGYVRGVRTSAGSSTAEPVVEERVVTKLVPVTREVAGSAAALLPITGATPGGVVFIGFCLMALGGAALLLTGGRRRRGLAVALLALVLTASACVSDPGDGSAEGRAGTSTEAAPGADGRQEEADETDETDDEQDDRVLGLRIERDRPPEETAEGAAEPGEVEVTEPSTEVVFEEVTTVEQVLVQAEPPPPTTLGSREGDNTVSIALDGGAPTITSARMISADQTEELLVSAGGTSSQLSATVSLRNLSDAPMVVRGTLVLEIASGSGATSELTSDAVDVVLGPGGETSASFTFSLPSGSYALTSAFRAY